MSSDKKIEFSNLPPKDLQYYSIEESMKILKFSRSKLWKLLNVDRTIPSYRIGRRVRIKRADLEEFMSKHKVQYSEV